MAATNHSPHSQPLRPGTPVLALSQGCVQAAKPQDAVHIQTLTTANQPCARVFSSRFLGDRVVNVHASVVCRQQGNALPCTTPVTSSHPARPWHNLLARHVIGIFLKHPPEGVGRATERLGIPWPGSRPLPSEQNPESLINKRTLLPLLFPSYSNHPTYPLYTTLHSPISTIKPVNLTTS